MDEIGGKTSRSKSQLLESATEKLRSLILEIEPGMEIGSVPEVTRLLGVGVITLRQIARVLEHEGLLEVRRGPGGGYFSKRPDNTVLACAFATYLRVHEFTYRDAFEILILLDCGMIPAAANTEDEGLQSSIAVLRARLEYCEKPEECVQFENDFRETIFKFSGRPFHEFMGRATMQLYTQQADELFFSDMDMIEKWKAGRARILLAILNKDEGLARFEAERYRQDVLSWGNWGKRLSLNSTD